MGQVTISNVVYDVYGDEAGFKSYMAGKVDSTDYDAAESSTRKKAMVSAARWLDREQWSGVPTDQVTPQPLAHPRIGLTDCDGLAVPQGTIHQDIIDASYELANILLGDAAAADSATQGSNVKQAKAGSAQVTFFRPGAADGSGTSAGVFPPLALKLVRCFLASSGSISGPTVTGTAQASSFCDDDYTLDQGFS